MKNHVFVDGISTIAFVGETVRIDLFVYGPPDRAAVGQPHPVPQHQLVLPASAFRNFAARIAEAAQVGEKTSPALVPAPMPAPVPVMVEEPATAAVTNFPAKKSRPPFP